MDYDCSFIGVMLVLGNRHGERYKKKVLHQDDEALCDTSQLQNDTNKQLDDSNKEIQRLKALNTSVQEEIEC